ncbi:thioesterase, FlK family [Nocardiopsis ganjiahuensis]|uniref:thioesterase, FlK family n=1 Tax=Nocardiopsis ganjiahuensis TaxID=239984 RepID=UPI0003482747|nr:acyl-CoA dehydrogenase family protein [Nocardiopsis ganjiahuensis]
MGREGQGVEIAHRSITEAGKPNLTAVALGIHQAVLETVVDYANTRRMYDRPLAAVESVRARIADIYSTLQISRMMAYQAADLLDNGFPADEWLLTAKLTATENAVAAAQQGTSILGARGGVRSYGMDRHLRDALVTLTPAGTSDVQKKRIADFALGRAAPFSPRPEPSLPPLADEVLQVALRSWDHDPHERMERTMLNGLRPGDEHSMRYRVPLEKTVPFLYPESSEFARVPPVLATGFMVGLMEWACLDALRPHLEPGTGSLGTRVSVTHTSATLPGMTVDVAVTCLRVEGNKILWHVVAHDDADRIGEGEHERTAVPLAKFRDRLDDKARVCAVPGLGSVEAQVAAAGITTAATREGRGDGSSLPG